MFRKTNLAIWPTAPTLLISIVVGCTGSLGGSGGVSGNPAGAGSAVPAGREAGAGSMVLSPAAPVTQGAGARVRRLSELEARNSVRDIFGDIDLSAAHFPVETEQGAFDNDAASLGFNVDFATAAQIVAEATGAHVSAQLMQFAPCAASVKSASDEASCVDAFLTSVGQRVYRRPLSSDETAGLAQLFTTTRRTEDIPTSFGTVVEAMLQSPFFLYRTELASLPGPLAPLLPTEVASELSYFLLRSTPDAALLDSATSGRLAERSEVILQAERLLNDPRAKDAIHAFFLEWLTMTSAAQIKKSDASFTPAVATSMVRELESLVDDVFWGQEPGYSKLFLQSSSMIDASLAPLYGVAGGGAGPTQLDPTQRSGFLTQVGFIATHTPGLNRSPVGLGHFVRTKLFCQTMAPPPPGVPPVPSDASLDVVARYKRHESDPSCAGCHSRMDSIGFGFAQYDVLGRYMPTDHGVVEDGLGTLSNTDVDGVFHGPVELGQKLSSSNDVRRCFSGTLLSYALGRQPTLNIDAAAVDAALASSFSTGDVKALLLSIVTSDAFLLRDTTGLPPRENRK